MSFDLSSLSAFFFVLAFWLLVEPFLDRNRNLHRCIITSFAVLIGIRYLWWRYFYTVSPIADVSMGEKVWVVAVYFTEILAFIEVSIFLLIIL